MEIKLSTKFTAELIGTFALVLFGCGAAAIAGGDTLAGTHGVGLFGIAFAFGVSVLVMCYVIGGISGCHINPAVTVGLLVGGKISPKNAAGYIVAQFIGAALAAFVLMNIMKGTPGFEMGEYALGSNGWGEGYQNGYDTTSAFLIESVMTFMFVFVIMGATSKWGNSTMAGVAIGLSLTLVHLVTIPVTGTSVNPARSFGPAIFAGGEALSHLWLFLTAPLIGAALAAIVWNAIDKKETRPKA